MLNLAQTKPEPDKFEELLERTSLRRTLRVCAWIKRFIHNCKNKENKLGPLLTEEIEDDVVGGLSESNGETKKLPATLKLANNST